MGTSTQSTLWRKRNLLLIAVLLSVVFVTGVHLKFVESSSLQTFLDRDWLSFKQKAQKKFAFHRFEPSPKVALLRLRYPSPLDFYFDHETRYQLQQQLKNYRGGILLNLNPSRILKDEYLSQLLSNPRL